MSRLHSRYESVSIADYNVLEIRSTDLCEELLAALERKERCVLFFANTNFVMQCCHLRAAMDDDEVIIVNDGLGMDIASLLVRGCRFYENMNGTDFIPFFLGQTRRPLKVFLLGGTATSVGKAALHIGRQLGHQIVGARDGYGGMKDQTRLLAAIDVAAPDILLVAMGNPLQEQWILSNRGTCNAGIMMGVGALFDYISGEQRRAPSVFRHLRLEWLFRLVNEPRRLLRRYSIDFLRFLYLCLRHKRRALPRNSRTSFFHR